MEDLHDVQICNIYNLGFRIGGLTLTSRSKMMIPGGVTWPSRIIVYFSLADTPKYEKTEDLLPSPSGSVGNCGFHSLHSSNLEA